MKLIVGLGNPGARYENTKHNIGFWVLEAFALKHQLSFSKGQGKALTSRGQYPGSELPTNFLLAMPQTFMNLSGHAVRSLLSYYKIPPSDFILIYDDLDLDLGRIRLKKRGGAGGHNGVASVIQEIGTDQFIRLKIGIEKDPRFNTADYVLSPFHKEKQAIIEQSIERAVELLPLLIEGQIDEAMNRFNAPVDP